VYFVMNKYIRDCLLLGGALAVGVIAGRLSKRPARSMRGMDELSSDQLEEGWESGGMNVGGPVAEEPMRVTQAGTSVSSDVTTEGGYKDAYGPHEAPVARPGI
jgi:hypothetical protein